VVIKRAERTPVPMHSHTFLISRWMKESEGSGTYSLCIENFQPTREEIMPLRVGENALFRLRSSIQRSVCSEGAVCKSLTSVQLRALNALAATGNRLI
jgi:hypothetical protein